MEILDQESKDSNKSATLTEPVLIEHIERRFYRTGNTFMFLGGMVLLLYGIIYGAYLGISKTLNDHRSAMIGLILVSIIICIIFGVLIIITTLSQLNGKRGNTNTQIFILVLACLTINFPGMVFITIGMIKQNFYQSRIEPINHEPEE